MNSETINKTSLAIGTTGRFELAIGLPGVGHVEIFDTFYINDLETDEIVKDPISLLEGESKKVTINEFLRLIDQIGYRLATLEETKIVKHMLNHMCSNHAIGKEKILLYFDEKMSEVRGLEPFKDQSIEGFRNPSLIKRLFDDSYEIESDDQVVMVCIKK